MFKGRAARFGAFVRANLPQWPEIRKQSSRKKVANQDTSLMRIKVATAIGCYQVGDEAELHHVESTRDLQATYDYGQQRHSHHTHWISLRSAP
ncbi:MAG: hypothetical protein E5W83_37440, partial [Mesorhizobium sp.]